MCLLDGYKELEGTVDYVRGTRGFNEEDELIAVLHVPFCFCLNEGCARYPNALKQYIMLWSNKWRCLVIDVKDRGSLSFSDDNQSVIETHGRRKSKLREPRVQGYLATKYE